jgi:protein-disulfide isomerase
LLLLGCGGPTKWPVDRTPDDWYAGPEAAAITIVEYGDYECPSCGATHRAIEEVRRARPDVGVVFRHFPTRKHPNAILAAEAAEAAGAQGQFWAMHSRLLDRQEEWYFRPDAATHFARYGTEIGLDVARFESDLASHRFRSKVLASKQAAGRVGVRGVPALFIDGLRIQRPPLKAAELLEELSEAERKRSGQT